MPMPADTNPAGDVFGGWIMAQVDIAGAVARRRAPGRVATIAVNFFLQAARCRPAIWCFFATIVHEGRTSVTVDVEVWAEHHPGSAYRQGHRSQLTYVAVDKKGIKRALRQRLTEHPASRPPGSSGAGTEHRRTFGPFSPFIGRQRGDNK